MPNSEADLEKAHQIVVQEYRRARDAGDAASSPYAYFLLRQQNLKRLLQQQGRGDFELHEMQTTGSEGPVVVDLRYLAPDVFGAPPDAE